ncbi:MAG: DUF4194 domain-containing protein, partial [Planctomycetota bacterium]
DDANASNEHATQTTFAVEAGEPWSHPLVRRQRMTLEQSLLVAVLRGMFVLHEQQTGVGGRPATVDVDELMSQYLTYIPDSGSDSRNEQKLRTLLEQLKGYGVITEVNKNDEVTIRPLIAHLADPASLTTLLKQMQRVANGDEQHSVATETANGARTAR